MAKFAHISRLIKDEQDAQKAYGAAAKKFPGSASTLKHIQRDEQHHERELRKERRGK